MSASETVTHRPNGPTVPCGSSTVTATGNFTTNGSGGTVYYHWVRTDDLGNHVIISEPPIVIAPGDTSQHRVATDRWTPQDPGNEQLVFTSPAYFVAAQSWSCVG